MAKNQKISYIPWIYRKVRTRLPIILFQSVLCILIAYTNIQFALITKNVVNSAISGDLELLKQSAALMIFLSMFRLFGNLFNQYLNVNIRESLERDFKRDILRRILRAEYSEVSAYHTGDLIQRMNGDASTVYSGVLTFTAGLSSQLTSLCTAFLALFGIAPEFTLAFSVVGIILASSALLFKRILKQLHKDSSAMSGKVNGFFYESISKLMIVQALDVSEVMEKRAERVQEERWKVRMKQRNISVLSKFGTSALASCSYLVTMLWCAAKLFSGQITYGDVTAMLSLISHARTSALHFPKMMPQFLNMTAACDRIMEIEALTPQPDPDVSDTTELYERMTGFTAEHLCFAYDRDPVMRDVNLTVPKGGLTVIVGPSGIGKSTLLKLLLGLYKPRSGRLLIDTPTGSVPVSRAARSLFSYAPQGNFLLSGTLRDNLTLTNPDASDELIQQALYVSAMDEYVAALPDGLETVLRENGEGLSEGQAQRLSLARAVISGAPVLLLDEVTSALDAVTEQIVLERITALPGKTCIAVTHRPAALELASHVIEVSEEGMTITAR